MLTLKHTKGSHPVAVFDGKPRTLSRFVFLGRRNLVDGEELVDALRALQRHSRHASTEPSPEEGQSVLLRPYRSGSFLPFLPQTENAERVVHYICGRSGAGKSTLAKQLSYYYSKIRNVYIVSPITDAAYSGTQVAVGDLVEIDDDNDYTKQCKAYEEAKIKLKYRKRAGDISDDDLMKLELLINEMKPVKTKCNVYRFTDKYKKLIAKSSLFIYDDTEAEPDQDKLAFLQKSQLLTGRHDDVSMIVMNHQANNGSKTRDTINEAHVFTFFAPWNRYTAYFVKEYLQLDQFATKQLRAMLRESRYVSVYKTHNLMLSEKKVLTI